MKGKNILITGGTGFLGSKIYDNFSSNNFVRSIGRSPGNDIICDLSTKVPQFFDTIFDTVIHCAGKAHSIPKNKQEIQQFNEVNFIGTKNLLKGIDSLSIFPNSFVFISSVAVYGVEQGVLINEQHLASPKTPYGITKKLAEDYIIQWGEKNNVKICIIRAPLIIGKFPLGNLKSLIDNIKSGRYLNIDKGQAKKSMVLAQDIISFIPVLIENEGVFNLTDGCHPSFFELSSLIAKNTTNKIIYNISINFAFILARLGDIIYYLLKIEAPLNSLKLKKITTTLTFDDTKARNIGWNPNCTLSKLHLWLD